MKGQRRNPPALYFAADRMNDARSAGARTNVLCEAMKHAVENGRGELLVTSFRGDSTEFLWRVVATARIIFDTIVAGDARLASLTLELENITPYGEGIDRVIGKLVVTKKPNTPHRVADSLPPGVGAILRAS